MRRVKYSRIIVTVVIIFAMSVGAMIGSASIAQAADECTPGVSTIAECFSDQNLARGVAENLDVHVDDIVTAKQIQDTWRLDLESKGIKSLQGIQIMKNLSVVLLDKNPIVDVSPLGHLTQLGTLSLAETKVVDVSPLSVLRLSSLDMSDTPITDTTSVGILPWLIKVDLSGTQIRDVAPLLWSTNIVELDLSGTDVSDISPLSRFMSLSKLDLYGARVSDVSKLNDVPNLSELYLGAQRIRANYSTGNGTVSMPAVKNANGANVPPLSVHPKDYTYDAKQGTISWSENSGNTYEYAFSTVCNFTHVKNVRYSGIVSNQDAYSAVHKVTFDSTGGSPVPALTVRDGNQASRPGDPIRAGYEFAGWYRDDGVLFDFSTPIREDMPLHAQWYYNPDQYLVTFDSQGGSSVDSQLVAYHASVSRPKDPVRSGYSFIGWCTDQGKPFDFTSPIASNLTLQARWEPNTYVVTMDPNGGKVSAGSKSVIQGKSYGSLPTPNRVGYKFAGWYTAKTGGTRIEPSSVFAEGRKVTLFAHWSETSTSSKPTTPGKPASPTAVSTVVMFRLYNRFTGEHFYTSSSVERDSLVKVGWRSEGTGWVAPVSGAPVYRLYNPYAPGGDHHYTMSTRERDALVKAGWRAEGIGWYSGGSVKVLREYNPYARTGTHNYTTDAKEDTALVKAGWRAEGTGWYAVKAK
ncbi:InlB B-repeat-containing protein [Bifidobacterium thermophilum]|uniref:InlB B-repeat-containing protein n=1 Tax=Bifidobacterium thermophilum TaxID=33905 RepID=UPI003993B8E6